MVVLSTGNLRNNFFIYTMKLAFHFEDFNKVYLVVSRYHYRKGKKLAIACLDLNRALGRCPDYQTTADYNGN